MKWEQIYVYVKKNDKGVIVQIQEEEPVGFVRTENGNQTGENVQSERFRLFGD